MLTAAPSHRLGLAFLLWLSACQTVTSVSGTWTGTMESPNKIRVRFVIADEGGKLSGLTYWEDPPDSGVFEPEANIVGSRTDGNASWTTETDVTIEGKFEGDTFKGTIRFPAHRDLVPAWSAPLTLKR